MKFPMKPVCYVLTNKLISHRFIIIVVVVVVVAAKARDQCPSCSRSDINIITKSLSKIKPTATTTRDTRHCRDPQTDRVCLLELLEHPDRCGRRCRCVCLMHDAHLQPLLLMLHSALRVTL